MRRKIAAVDGGDVARIQRAQILRVIPVVEMTAKALEAIHGRERRLQPFDGVAVPAQPKSRALTADSRYRPRLVGEVRWASTGRGSSWKLSGGSIWSSAVTKVSK